MRNLLRIFAALAMLAVVGTIAAPAASARPSCTEEYWACINESGQLLEPYRTLGDIECGLAYTGCVARKLRFW